jgi:hypothetical protein
MQTRTGKTITAFETVKKLEKKQVLFVTKLKAIPSIQNDYQYYAQYFQIKIINYESVSKIHGAFDIVIIDEAHSLGKFPKPAKRVKDLIKFTKGLPIIYLSATPTPESYSQLYHQFFVSSFSPFKQYLNFYKWAYYFVKKKIKYLYNREINDYSDANIEMINKLTNHLFITQTQADSGFKVILEEKTLHCEMNETQKYLIQKLKKDRIVSGPDGAIVLADTAVKLQSKIHQICSGSVKDEEGNAHVISHIKAEFIKQYFDGKKIAVFYKFIGERTILINTFNNWTESPEEFQLSADKIFIGQFQSSREGIRLDRAEAIVFMNIDFSYLSYEQSKNRILSKERDHKATLYWIFSIGGIEEKIYPVVQNKKDYTLYHFKKDFLRCETNLYNDVITKSIGMIHA